MTAKKSVVKATVVKPVAPPKEYWIVLNEDDCSFNYCSSEEESKEYVQELIEDCNTDPDYITVFVSTRKLEVSRPTVVFKDA